MNRAVIIGATGTIGQAVARRLVRANRPVLLIGRNGDKLESLAKELKQPFAVVDMSNSQFLEDALKPYNKLDEPQQCSSIVNCIGSVLLKPAHLTSDEDFRKVFETNLFSAFATVKVGSKLLKRSGGSILLFASAAAEIGINNHEAIAASKGGVIGLVRSAAATYAMNNIRVNAISPGLIKTTMTKGIWGNERAAEASSKMHALGRLGEAEGVASLAQWLLEPEADFVTGQVYGIDGGLGHVMSTQK
jgi:3-oxoacyl-[acyl-carrier protein] reductase